jgi:hypothetical protein
LIPLIPLITQRVLSYNGSEFKAQFTKIVLDDGAVRWLTYPKCPKMNAHAERFNRTIQEEFIEFHKDLLFEDIDAFNDKLLDYLIWFNESRPHYALGLRSPMQFLSEEHQCNMYWRDTTEAAFGQRCVTLLMLFSIVGGGKSGELADQLIQSKR